MQMSHPSWRLIGGERETEEEEERNADLLARKMS